MQTSKPAFRRAPLAVGISLALATGLAQAATFNVTSNADSGAGSLRQAIVDANGSAGPHTIDMGGISGDTIVLESNLTDISEEVELLGSEVTIDGDGAFSCLYSTYDLSVSDVTVTNCTGHPYGGYTYGGGIEVYGGALTVTNSTITGNSAYAGGGVIVNGPLTVTSSTISGNAATSSGGGFLSFGGLDLTDSTVSGNSADAFGGGYVYADYGFAGQTIAVSGSTISGNSATTFGGGLALGSYTYEADPAAAITLSNSTVSGNSSPQGAGLYVLNSGFSGKYGSIEPQLLGSTITANTATAGAGGGFVMANGAAYSYGYYYASPAMDNSIIQGNSSASGSADIETDAALGGGPVSFAGFAQEAANNPQKFRRWGMAHRALKAGVDPGAVSNEQISDFFASRAERFSRGGASVGVDFVVDFSIVGAAPTTGGFTPDTATSSNLGSNPMLGGLASNGGPTMTHMPSFSGSAVNLIPGGSGGCGATFNVDQRGEARPDATTGSCDAGSVEADLNGLPIGPQAVPTLSHWASILMALGLGVMGWLGLRKRSDASTG